MRRLVPRCPPAGEGGNDSKSTAEVPLSSLLLPGAKSKDSRCARTLPRAASTRNLSGVRRNQRWLGRKRGHGRARVPLRICSRQGSIWYPINLLAATAYAESLRFATASLNAFHLGSFSIAVVIHLLTSLLVGLLYGAMLPMFPRRPIFLGGIIAPILWTGLLYSMLELINPLLNRRIDWQWFVASQFAFGIVAGLVVVRQERVRTRQFVPFSVRAGIEAPGMTRRKTGPGRIEMKFPPSHPRNAEPLRTCFVRMCERTRAGRSRSKCRSFRAKFQISRLSTRRTVRVATARTERAERRSLSRIPCTSRLQTTQSFARAAANGIPGRQCLLLRKAPAACSPTNRSM